jgi:hypothetical protein
MLNSVYRLWALLILLLPVIIWPVSASTDATPPVWPAGSRVMATRLTSSSIDISWTPATDDSGSVSYKVLENGWWDGMYHLSPGVGRSYLAPNTTITFQVIAYDPSNNWSNGPSATFSTAPAGCQGYEACLTSLFTYSPTSTPDGRIMVNDTLTDYGLDSIRITSIAVTGDLGAYSLTSGTPLLLRVGEIGNRGLAINVPNDATIGTHTIFFSASWSYNGTVDGWRMANDIHQNGTLLVTSSPAQNQPNLLGVTNLVHTVLGYGYLLLGGYLAIVSLAVGLVIRNDRRKRADLLKPNSPE